MKRLTKRTKLFYGLGFSAQGKKSDKKMTAIVFILNYPISRSRYAEIREQLNQI